MGLRSGEFPGQSNTFDLCFINIILTFLDEVHGEQSYWNIPSPSGNTLLISGMIFLSNTSIYWSESIIPSIGKSELIFQKI